MLALCAALQFSGCSSSNKTAGVPDRYLETDATDYYYSEDLEGNYSFTSVHDYDKSSNTDRVEIQLRINHEIADEVVQGVCTYQYDKEADTWHRVGAVRWGEMKLEYKPEAIKQKTFKGQWFSTEWEATVQELNLDNNTIKCKIRMYDTDYGMEFESDGFETFSLGKGKWYSFSFTAYGNKFEAILYEDRISIYEE